MYVSVQIKFLRNCWVVPYINKLAEQNILEVIFLIPQLNHFESEHFSKNSHKYCNIINVSKRKLNYRL